MIKLLKKYVGHVIERIFYAFHSVISPFYYFFHFHKEITELNVNLTFSIIWALNFFKLMSNESLTFLQQNPIKKKWGGL